jgi:hypothetical protein
VIPFIGSIPYASARKQLTSHTESGLYRAMYRSAVAVDVGRSPAKYKVPSIGFESISRAGSPFTGT